MSVYYNIIIKYFFFFSKDTYITNYSKDMYNGTKKITFQVNFAISTFYSSKNPEKCTIDSKKI